MIELHHESILIEGQCGAGKTTLAGMLAQVGYRSFNTGALFRGMSLSVPKDNISLPELFDYAQETSVMMSSQDLIMNGHYLSFQMLQLPNATRLSSQHLIGERLEQLFDNEVTYYTHKPVVIEGKALGGRFNVPIGQRFYLSATQEVRALRKQQAAHALGEVAYSFSRSLHDIRERDKKDAAILRIHPASRVIDTTNMNAVEVYKIIVAALTPREMV